MTTIRNGSLVRTSHPSTRAPWYNGAGHGVRLIKECPGGGS